jgi:Zn-dependent metalloprotease
MSDIFGAVVERLHLHKTVNDTWLVAEDVFIHGGALRNMQDPAAFDCVDYFPDMEDDYYYCSYYNDCSGDGSGGRKDGWGMHMNEMHNFR